MPRDEGESILRSQLEEEGRWPRRGRAQKTERGRSQDDGIDAMSGATIGVFLVYLAAEQKRLLEV